MLATPDNTELLANIGKLVAGALVVGGSGWAVIRSWARNQKLDDARTTIDVNSLAAYDGTIQMLRKDVEQIRADKDAADAKWRADMAQLEQRLQVMSGQVDSAITRARTAEAIADKLRAQLREHNLEPCA